MESTVRAIEKDKIIVIVRGVARDKLIPLAESMYNGGIRLIECTYDAKGIISNEEMASRIAMLADHFGNDMLVGAGTVLSTEQVELTKNAGGKFIISPDTNPEVIAKTKELGLVSSPGALTPTEIAAAYAAGADFVKLFPIDVIGGAKYVKSVKAPLSHIRMLAVGGVTENNLREFIDSGACGIGVGSGIIDKNLIEKGDFEAITKLAERYTSQIQ